jgi:hypothetical protein
MSTRSRVLAAAGLALALIGAGSGGMSAAAAGDLASAPAVSPMDTVTVTSDSFAPTPGGEQLSITVDTSAQLTGMIAHLTNTSTNDETSETMQPPAAGAPAAGASTWTAPVTAGTAQGDLPPGTYSLTVDVTFQDGTQIPGIPGATLLPFQQTPSFVLKFNTVLSHDNQDPAVTGTVDVLNPGATAGTPYAGQPVTLVTAAPAQGSVTENTDSNGGFTFSLTNPRPGETVFVEVPGSATVAAGQAQVTLTAHYDPVKMSASLSAGTVTYGGKVSVRGTVSYAPGAGAFVPLHGQTVRIYDQAGGVTTAAGSAVTDGKGSFTATLPKVATSVHWVLQASGPYLNTATSTLPMKVNLPTAVTGFVATLNQFWQVSFHGCLGLSAHVPGNVPSLAGLTIQYSIHPGGPWHTLGTVAKQTSYACGSGGLTFSGTRTAQVNYAYYRAVYAGGADQAGTGYLPSASGAPLAWKYEDRITSFAVSKRVVSKGGKLTVSGRLQYYSAKWRDYAGQQVLVILRPQGSKTWYYIATPKTNPAGLFSATFTDPVSATWSAEFLGNSAHLATVAGMIYVQLNS